MSGPAAVPFPKGVSNPSADRAGAGPPEGLDLRADAAVGPSRPAGPPEILLLVDDDAAYRQAFASFFRQAGYTCWEAGTAAETLRRAADRPDLVILDVNLPDLNGFEVCRRLKQDPATASIPVLQVSGERVTPADRVWGLEGGADGYLVKPAEPQEVLAYARALLRARRAEKDCQASEAWLQAIINNAPAVILVKDLDGRYLLVNHKWESLFGRSREWVVGKTVFDVFPQERAEALRANDLRVIETRAPQQFEEVVVEGDQTHTFLSFKFPLFGPGGDLVGVGSIATDITERKRMDQALQESEALYHSLVENLPLCIFRKDLKGRFTFGNQKFCETLKRPLGEVVGRTDFDFYPANLAHKYRQDDARVLASGEVLEEVEKNQRPGADPVYVQVLKAPVRDAQGRVAGVQGFFWDITARKRAEKELERAAGEFRAARKIQQKLFPAVTPHVAGPGGAPLGFDIGGVSFPAEAIGGDFFDYLALPDGSLGVAIGDVSGHGLGPAILMAELRAFLRAFAQTQADAGTVLSLTNRVLAPDVEEDRFVTLLLARLDPASRSLTYASAGHQTCYVLGGAGQVKHPLDSNGIPLGIFPEMDYQAAGPVALEPGDLVLLVTDGIVEARAPDGAVFGTERTTATAWANRHQPARQIAEDLYHAVRAFSQHFPQYDDITATVIKVEPAA